jgi:hypothetical protein
MIWVLIIVVTGWGGYSDQVEFNTKVACEEAAVKLNKKHFFDPFTATCVEKGIKQ